MDHLFQRKELPQMLLDNIVNLEPECARVVETVVTDSPVQKVPEGDEDMNRIVVVKHAEVMGLAVLKN